MKGREIMKKYGIPIFLSLCFATILLSTTALAAAVADWTLTRKSDDFNDENYNNYILTISGNGTMADYSHASNNYSPWNRKNITDIIIENGITRIGDVGGLSMKRTIKGVAPFLIPLFFTLLFGGAFSPVSNTDVPVLIYDMDGSNESRQLVDYFVEYP